MASPGPVFGNVPRTPRARMLRKLDRRRAANYEPRVIAFRFVPGDDLRVEVLDEEHQLFEWWVNGGLGWQDVIEEQIAIAP